MTPNPQEMRHELAVCGGTGVLFYVLMWIFVPLEEPGFNRASGQQPSA